MQPVQLQEGTTLAVMQPYLFPYIGYYQLAAVTDRFVLMDDVTYIKQGWINRNRLLVNGRPAWFTLPVSGAGSHVRIADVAVEERSYPHWRRKFFRMLEQAYGRAPRFAPIAKLLDHVFPPSLAPGTGIASVAADSLTAVMTYLELPFQTCLSSGLENVDGVRSVHRVQQICRQFRATRYVNLPGGAALYDRQLFADQDIDLRFVTPGRLALVAGAAPDGSQLSMLHLLMHRDPANVRSLLHQYSLV